jgi:hypothetical protein
MISMNWGVRMYSSQVSASTFSIPPRILRISSVGGEPGENWDQTLAMFAKESVQSYCKAVTWSKYLFRLSLFIVGF